VTDIDRQVASRLREEAQRKGLNADTLAQEADLPPDVVQAYFSAKRTIDFGELRPLCKALSISLVNLARSDFPRANLSYRDMGARNRHLAGEIEYGFLLLKEFIQPPELPSISFHRHAPQENAYRNLIGDVATLVEQFRIHYPRVEDFIENTGLPILPIHAADSDFDAFLLSHKVHCVVCLNMEKPTGRIHFSLLHEIAHVLLHRDQNLPAAEKVAEEVTLPSELYSTWIPDHARPEFVANKFAQFYLLPIETVSRFNSRTLDSDNTIDLLKKHRTSREVLWNALYDAALLRGSGELFSSIRDRVKATVPENPQVDHGLRRFIEECGKQLRQQIQAWQDEFGQDVWDRIARAWELNGDA
jgi:Zn-dependent peptidase ImmA (M78 family)